MMTWHASGPWALIQKIHESMYVKMSQLATCYLLWKLWIAQFWFNCVFSSRNEGALIVDEVGCLRVHPQKMLDFYVPWDAISCNLRLWLHFWGGSLIMTTFFLSPLFTHLYIIPIFWIPILWIFQFNGQISCPPNFLIFSIILVIFSENAANWTHTITIKEKKNRVIYKDYWS